MKNIFRQLLIVAIPIFAWYAVSLNINPLFVPGPDKVVQGVVSLGTTGQLMNGILFSFCRVTIASALSAGISLIIGVLIYSFRPIRETIFPAVKMLRFVPVTAFYPLLIMWCGIGEKMKITFLLTVTFVSMMPAVVLAFNDVSPDLIDTGKTIGMSKWQVIFMVVLPDAAPAIFNNFALLISIGWTYVPFVETINAKYGLGYIIHQASSRGRTDLMFSAIAVIMAISVMCDRTTEYVGKHIFRWKNIKGDQ